MFPSCAGGNCNVWGIGKVVDGREKSTSSLGITSYGTNPYMQLDLGRLRSDILQVRLVARADAGLSQSQYLNVYLSATTDFRGVNSTLCDDNITFDVLGDDYIALCPVNFTARYVTVMKNGTNYLSLQEVQPMVDGECWVLGRCWQQQAGTLITQCTAQHLWLPADKAAATKVPGMDSAV